MNSVNDHRLQYRDPGLDVIECLSVKQQVFEPRQWTVFIYSTTFLEHVAVTFEIVARRTYTRDVTTSSTVSKLTNYTTMTQKKRHTFIFVITEMSSNSLRI